MLSAIIASDAPIAPTKWWIIASEMVKGSQWLKLDFGHSSGIAGNVYQPVEFTFRVFGNI